MLAGYETTSTALTYSLFVLARYPDEQEKLFNELHQHSDTNPFEPNYDNVMKLTYLDMFIKEVLRFYPIGNSYKLQNY
jgi:cytochrome P450